MAEKRARDDDHDDTGKRARVVDLVLAPPAGSRSRKAKQAARRAERKGWREQFGLSVEEQDRVRMYEHVTRSYEAGGRGEDLYMGAMRFFQLGSVTADQRRRYRAACEAYPSDDDVDIADDPYEGTVVVPGLPVDVWRDEVLPWVRDFDSLLALRLVSRRMRWLVDSVCALWNRSHGNLKFWMDRRRRGRERWYATVDADFSRGEVLPYAHANIGKELRYHVMCDLAVTAYPSGTASEAAAMRMWGRVVTALRLRKRDRLSRDLQRFVRNFYIRVLKHLDLCRGPLQQDAVYRHRATEWLQARVRESGLHM